MYIIDDIYKSNNGNDVKYYKYISEYNLHKNTSIK